MDKTRLATNMLETAQIPGTDIHISRVGLGTWAIGGWMWGGSDEALAIRTIQTAFDHGITLVDTAPVYGFGHSEEIVGKALAGARLRDRAIIATKAGLDWKDGKPFRNASRVCIFQEVEASLRRLQTDHIDIYQIHWPDPATPIEETAQAMQELLEQGKIRAIGVSNFSVPQIEEFRKVAPLHLAQPPYNLFERAIERDVLPYCQAHAIATLGYGALCRGLLSGSISSDSRFTGDDLRQTDPKFHQPRFNQYLAAVARLEKLAKERYGKSVIDLAVRWSLDTGMTSALWGARRPDQLAPVDQVSGWYIDEDGRAAIDEIIREEITDPVGPEFMAPPSRARSRLTLNISERKPT
jgi:aryl-alcohol dehydrogenase-like predicted oxidoreductase